MSALSGVRVIDFGQYIAGPLAAMLLADQGADVVRIDPPVGPRWQTPANTTWNRGKRSAVIDLKAAAGRDAARALIAAADVVVENFRPGTMDRLGLGAGEALATNPRLVYLSLPGFAPDDSRATLPAWEGVVGAATGAYARPGGGAPVFTAVPIASSYAAMLGAMAVAVALGVRERAGTGQHVEVPLFDATFQAIGVRGQRVHSTDAPTIAGPSAWVRQYECADGRWVQFHAANSRFIRQFLEAAGVAHWQDAGLPTRQQLAADPAAGRELMERMAALFRTKSAAEWEDLVSAAGTPCAVCRDTAEWIEHPHARESGMVIELDDPALGRVKQPGLQVVMSATPGAVRGPAPLPGADTAAVVASAAPVAWKAAAAPPPAATFPAFAGVRVLDLCIILAGPTCGRTLAEFGADVIKIDNPNREGGVAFHTDINRGKRSILLDLEKPEAREVFWALAETADVVVQNYRQGSLDRLGIDYESVRRRRPDIVYASLNAYGETGPWARRPGWEQLAQAATGMQKRFGGDGPPVLQPFPVNDYGTGFMGAYAVALALLHRQRTGEGQHVQTALARTACTLQSVFFHDFAGKRWDEPRGQQALGTGPADRLYRAADGWFYLAAGPAGLAALAGVAGLEGLPAGDAAAAERWLEDRFGARPCAEWTAALAARGLGAHRVATVEELMVEPWAQAHGLSLTRELPGLGAVTHIGPSARLSLTPMVPGCPTPHPGADVATIVDEIGRAHDLDRLVAAGAIAIPATP